MGELRVIGVRHHSPACARLVRTCIAHWQPQAVLIEGPSDFNPRIGELLLGHELPLALYSYANGEDGPAQCWFPFLEFSPEWVALQAGHAAGAQLRFIDLPHWRYRTLPDAERRSAGARPGRSRYGEVTERLCRRFGCDGDDALWDHLFESLPEGSSELSSRLDLYFGELRGDDPGSEQDQAREAHMAQWLAWAAARHTRVLVVCGGWHRPVLERMWPTLTVKAEPEVPQPADERAAGSYLVPYEYRQVDALGGYGAGMPSPMFYQWAWQQGMAAAGRQAQQQIVQRLRRRQVALSTADLIAFGQAARGLAALRGHVQPLRVDLLDALQSALVKEALDAPPPWSGSRLLGTQHHPLLREALLALTGEGAGRLHGDTPLPPLLHDVRQRLLACALQPTSTPQTLVLDRRHSEDVLRSRLLWQLAGLGVGGAQLMKTQAPRAARSLSAALNFEEHWRVQQDERWYPDLIEAAVHGATLQAAARQRLLHDMADAGGKPAALAQGLMQAVRAGLFDIGHELAAALHSGLPSCHEHGALAEAALALAQLAQAGFWGEDPRALLQDTLVLLADRLLWLLEGRDGPGSPEMLDADVRAAAVFDTLLSLALPGLDAGFALQTLLRVARAPSKPPALRGAALAVAFQQQAWGEDKLAAQAEVLALTRAMPPRDALGDFLYGLFSAARALATSSDEIVRAVHAALEGMGDEDFLVALPQLRNAFAWFPPRERGALAAQVAALLGLGAAGQQQLLRLREGTAALLDARRIEAQALAWAQAIGLDAPRP